MKYAVAIAAATAAVLGLAGPASAVTYSFTLTGDYEASWELDSDPTPENSNDFFFRVTNVTGNFPGLTDTSAILDFYTQVLLDGGFTIFDEAAGVVLADAVGIQLFSGLTSDPTFLTGTFNLHGNGNGQAFQLVIAPTAAVPEPATWAMMIAGFGLVGGAMRRTSMRTRVSYAA